MSRRQVWWEQGGGAGQTTVGSVGGMETQPGNTGRHPDQHLL